MVVLVALLACSQAPSKPVHGRLGSAVESELTTVIVSSETGQDTGGPIKPEEPAIEWVQVDTACPVEGGATGAEPVVVPATVAVGGILGDQEGGALGVLGILPDMDGDGGAEMVTGFDSSDGYVEYLGLFTSVQVATWASGMDMSVGWNSLLSNYMPGAPVTAVDLDLDGDLELGANAGSYSFYDIQLGTGDAPVYDSLLWTCGGGSSGSDEPALADLTGDGQLDYFYGLSTWGSQAVMGLYETSRRYPADDSCFESGDLVVFDFAQPFPSSSGEYSALDYDGDGVLDVAASRTSLSRVDVLGGPFPLGSAELLDLTLARWWARPLDRPHSLSTDGDVDGDGLLDVLVGPDGLEAQEPPSWFAWLIASSDYELGNQSLCTSTALFSLPAEGNEFLNMIKVEILGDLDGDGFDDLAMNPIDSFYGLGTPLYVWFGPVTGDQSMEDGADVQIEGAAGVWFGAGFDGGDITGDGYADIAVGSSSDVGDIQGAGIVFVLDGTTIRP